MSNETDSRTIEEREFDLANKMLALIEAGNAPVSDYIAFRKFLAERPAVAVPVSIEACPACGNVDVRIVKSSRVFKMACMCGQRQSTASSLPQLLENWKP